MSLIFTREGVVPEGKIYIPSSPVQASDSRIYGPGESIRQMQVNSIDINDDIEFVKLEYSRDGNYAYQVPNGKVLMTNQNAQNNTSFTNSGLGILSLSNVSSYTSPVRFDNINFIGPLSVITGKVARGGNFTNRASVYFSGYLVKSSVVDSSFFPSDSELPDSMDITVDGMSVSGSFTVGHNPYPYVFYGDGGYEQWDSPGFGNAINFSYTYPNSGTYFMVFGINNTYYVKNISV